MVSKPQYVIDVRSQDEYAKGHLQGAILIPHTEVEKMLPAAVADQNAAIALYCGSGRRAGVAREKMAEMGYRNVVNLGSLEEAAEVLKRPVVP